MQIDFNSHNLVSGLLLDTLPSLAFVSPLAAVVSPRGLEMARSDDHASVAKGASFGSISQICSMADAAKFSLSVVASAMSAWADLLCLLLSPAVLILL